MRPISRVSLRGDIFVSPRRSASPSTLCVFCQHRQSTPFSTSISRSAKDPSKLTFLERTRNRIWGTDKPPGYDDPYTGRNFPRDRQGVERKDDGKVVNLGGTEAGVEDDITALKRARKEARLEQKRAMMEAIADAPHHEDYVPATTTEGMETVTGEEEYDELGRSFQGHLLPHRLRSELELSSAVYHALVEVYAKISVDEPLRRFQPPLSIISDALSVKIQPSPDGLGAVLEFPNEEVKTTVLDSITEKKKTKAASEVAVPGLDEAEAVPAVNTENEQLNTATSGAEEEAIDLGDVSAASAENQDLLGELDRAADLEALTELASIRPREWRNISISHPSVKLAVVRRTSQLIGFRIPDTLISQADTAGALLSGLVNMQKKPKTVFDAITGVNVEEALDGRENEMVRRKVKEAAPLVDLPNVRIAGRRETVVDKERRLGRLKVIEEELKKRDLPMLGERGRASIWA